MKPCSCIVCLLLLTTFTASAQFTFGIQAGHLKTWQTSYDGSKNGALPTVNGFSGSLLFYYKIGKFLQVGIEPGIAQRGTSRNNYYDEAFPNAFFFPTFIQTSIDFLPPAQGAFYSTFIQLPVMAKMQVQLDGDKLSFFVKSGTGPSWMASGYYEEGFLAFGGNGPIGQVDFSKNHNVRRWDVGLFESAGIEFKVGPGHALMGVDGYFGFMGISKHGRSKNRGYGLSLGYSTDL